MEVSTDQGQIWQRAQLKRDEALQDDSSRQWHWVRWHAKAVVDIQNTNGEVWARACIEDAGKHPDPDGLHSIQATSEKRGGYLYNGYHKVNFVDNCYQRMGAHQTEGAGFSNNQVLGDAWVSKRNQL